MNRVAEFKPDISAMAFLAVTEYCPLDTKLHYVSSAMAVSPAKRTSIQPELCLSQMKGSSFGTPRKQVGAFGEHMCWSNIIPAEKALPLNYLPNSDVYCSQKIGIRHLQLSLPRCSRNKKESHCQQGRI